jgi:hypothetical protein
LASSEFAEWARLGLGAEGGGAGRRGRSPLAVRLAVHCPASRTARGLLSANGRTWLLSTATTTSAIREGQVNDTHVPPQKPPTSTSTPAAGCAQLSAPPPAEWGMRAGAPRATTSEPVGAPEPARSLARPSSPRSPPCHTARSSRAWPLAARTHWCCCGTCTTAPRSWRPARWTRRASRRSCRVRPGKAWQAAQVAPPALAGWSSSPS